MKSLLNGRRFINKRNFCNEQAPSAEVVYIDAVHTQRSTADLIGMDCVCLTSGWSNASGLLPTVSDSSEDDPETCHRNFDPSRRGADSTGNQT